MSRYTINPITGKLDISPDDGDYPSSDNIGQPGGLATLDENGLVPTSQLPGYVDELVEAADFASLPVSGDSTKVYVTLDNNNLYRWSGSEYVQVNDAVSSAEQATRLSTPRNIELTGEATGNVDFDGQTDVDIEVTVPGLVGATGGYEFTAAFTDRDVTGGGAIQIGTNVSYDSSDVAAGRWRRFGFSSARQIANDTPYWGDGADANEAPHAGSIDYQGVGLFSGAYMPAEVTSMFDFSQDDAYNQELTTGDNPYNAATGSYDFSECKVGDLALVRFDFNIVPQFANTTIEVGLIWSTRDSSDNITFTFPLLTSPIFFGAGSVGNVYLNRPIITAYFASGEDVNARALPAIRSDQPVLIQPLTTLVTIQR